MNKFWLLFLLLMLPVQAIAQDLNTSAKQVYMIDYDTGTVLFEKNADQRMPTSSMSKTMTAYVIFDAIKNKQISLNDSFLISERAWKKGGSKMFIEVGKRVKIEDLLKGLIIQSGNDAAIALAEGLMATEDEFAKHMNDTAKNLGMNSSNFRNASGWPDPDHYSTASDLAKMAVALITNHPEYYKYYSQKEFEFNNIKQKNRNPLLFKNMGVDGIKTGHTNAGGYGLIASGKRNNRRVVLVINGLESSRNRAEESARILEWGLGGYKNAKVLSANDNIASLEVLFGDKKKLQATTAKDIIVSVPNTEIANIKLEVKYKRPIVAPIKGGDVVGSIVVKIPKMKDIEFPLIASENIEEAGFISKAFTKMGLFAFGDKDE